MSLNFNISTAQTVSNTYSWDLGEPYTINAPGITPSFTPTFVQGYAPGLRVTFANTSNILNGANEIFYWNFGDAYNDVNNVVAVSGLDSVQHDYVVPGTYTVTLCSSYDYTIKTNIINVLEIPPSAGLQLLTQPVTGNQELTVTVTPHKTKSGSFPIDQIDWNPGDGSPSSTVTRYTQPDLTKFIFTNKFPLDPLDPRNYSLVHTYKRKTNDYALFYPSITAYGSTTCLQDSCSLTIGPILLSNFNSKLHLLKSGKSSTGNILYAIQNKDNIGLISNKQTIQVSNYTSYIPQNIIKDTTQLPEPSYTGNAGSLNYPPLVVELDPTFNDVSLLMRFDGLNGSTVFIDESFNSVNLTTFGDARITTSQVKYGVGSGLFNGSNAYISAPNSSLFNFSSTDDFTIEGWIYFNTLNVPGPFKTIPLAAKGSQAVQYGWAFFYDTGALYFSRPWISNDIQATWTPTLNTWHYIAVSRTSGVIRLFINNTLAATSNNTIEYSNTAPVTIGKSHVETYLNGYIDELRITKGVGRYTTAANLPPSGPFLGNETPYY